MISTNSRSKKYFEENNKLEQALKTSIIREELINNSVITKMIQNRTLDFIFYNGIPKYGASYLGATMIQQGKIQIVDMVVLGWGYKATVSRTWESFYLNLDNSITFDTGDA